MKQGNLYPSLRLEQARSARIIPGVYPAPGGGRGPGRGIPPGALSPLQLASLISKVAWLSSPSTRIFGGRICRVTPRAR